MCEWTCEVVGPAEAGVRALDYSYLPPNERRAILHVVHQQQVAHAANDKAPQIRLAASVDSNSATKERSGAEQRSAPQHPLCLHFSV